MKKVIFLIFLFYIGTINAQLTPEYSSKLRDYLTNGDEIHREIDKLVNNTIRIWKNDPTKPDRVVLLNLSLQIKRFSFSFFGKDATILILFLKCSDEIRNENIRENVLQNLNLSIRDIEKALESLGRAKQKFGSRIYAHLFDKIVNKLKKEETILKFFHDEITKI